ncbi:hypothetical protein N24_2974 [Corynebacterium suranareeae]|uniref:Uncharacterized protein n=1 Tax=Corynebacterium suranareeae TaxID=2506452 RepID=A0A169S7A9_9CORY|nr:DUF732 domain-containing protein [Corynebacterium suranareeae]BAU97236.1 hypothetical protein N24_2974 [Corynebacterium suranareeae]
MKRILATLAAALLSVSLAACGGVTVEGDDTTGNATGTVPTEEQSSGSSSTERTSERSGQASQSNGSTARDGAAEEIDGLPEATVERSAEAQAFLDELTDKNIDVSGVEDQLIATAQNYCNSENKDENVTVDAVAGQLIVQGRTSVQEEQAAEISTLLKESADRTYC